MGGVLRVRYLGLARRVVDVEEETISYEAGVTVREVLGRLMSRHGTDAQDLLFTGRGTLRPAVRLLLEQEAVEEHRGLDRRLAGDEAHLLVVVVDPFAGG